MGYGIRPHDWKTYELESMKRLSVSPRLLVRVLIPPRSTFHTPSSPTSMNTKQSCRPPRTEDGMEYSYLGLFRLYARS
jgi:hypothetical protein